MPPIARIAEKSRMLAQISTSLGQGIRVKARRIFRIGDDTPEALNDCTAPLSKNSWNLAGNRRNLLNVRRKLSFPFLLLLPLLPAFSQQKNSAATDALYSSAHSVIIPGNERFTKKIFAPDGLKFVTAKLVDDELQRIEVTVGGHTVPLQTKGRGAEILWSPDSRWLAVTYTWCCSGFSPYLHVYEVSESGVRDLHVQRELTSGFETGIRCEKGTPASQWALTAAVKWLDSSHLLAAVQVSDVSVCDSMGVFELREISVPELSILKTYDQLQAKRLFRNDLGGNLLDANDACVHDPKSCWVASHHSDQQ